MSHKSMQNGRLNRFEFELLLSEPTRLQTPDQRIRPPERISDCTELGDVRCPMKVKRKEDKSSCTYQDKTCMNVQVSTCSMLKML